MAEFSHLSADPARKGTSIAAATHRLWHRINAPFTRLASRFSRPYFLRLDAFALWFYAVCLAAFVILSALGFHGSSSEIYGDGFHLSEGRDPAIFGHWRPTRVDEWAFHTPAILNQIFREDPLAATGSADGPGKAALLSNVPCRHFTEFCRPQFWAFHFLPAELAFSIYWQAKALLLLTGVFTLLLLLSGGASRLAAFGALWFFFSAYTQWTYSWPSLLPEMIGLFGWVVCLGCYLLVGRSPWRLALAALGCAAGMVDFALCAYPPQQIPLVTIGGFLTGWWLCSRRHLIFAREGRPARVLAICGCVGLTAILMVGFFIDAREVIGAAARTVYPGQRICSGGGVSADAYAAHFLDLWKTETHFPPALGNPSEGTGYLWLAPLTLLGLGPRRAALPRDTRNALLCCWGAFLCIGAWMSLPVPSWVGHWFFYDKVVPARCFHALGLANVAIVVLALSGPKIDSPPRTLAVCTCRLAGFSLVAFSVLCAVNRAIGFYYPFTVIAAASMYAGLLALGTTERWKAALAALVLLPGIVVTGQINPSQRHLDVITKSSLFALAQQHPEYRHGKWIIYSDRVAPSGFFSAVGLRNVNSLKVIPQVSDMNRFDLAGKYASVINQSGYVITRSLPEDGPSVFKSPASGAIFWSVSPLDPLLKKIGVRYAAFAKQPDTATADKLKLLNPAPIAGMWLYELP